MRELFVGWFDYYAERASNRLAGLTDGEYLWEPVPNCWSVRWSGEHTVVDWSFPPPNPEPVTTIAWRLVHVSSMLREHGLRAVAFEGGRAKHVPPSEVPGNAPDALASFVRAMRRWKYDIEHVSEARLGERLGPEAGPYANDVVASFIEHIHDEFIHHTAEIALLRDLYRNRRQFRG
jgi:hypothetical protein